MGSDRRKHVFALGIGAVVLVACGQIAGLSDPADIEISDSGPGPADDASTIDQIEISPQTIELGAVTCGASSTKTDKIVIKNRGKTTPKYSVKLSDGSPFNLTGQIAGDLAPDASVEVGIVAKPTVAGDNEADIVVTAGSVVVQVKAKAVGEGGQLDFAPSIANFGPVRRENGGSLEVSLTNRGNKPVTLTKIDSSLPEFSATTWEGAPAPLTFEPGAVKKLTVKLAAGGDTSLLDAMLTLGLDGAHCGTPPTLPVQGQRVNLEVTISPADFGTQDCVTTPTLQRAIVISNYTSSSLNYTATLLSDPNSKFSIVSGKTDTIPAGTSATPTTRSVTLAMKPIGATVGAIVENVEVDITGVPSPSGGKRNVEAKALVRGVIAAINPAQSTGFRRGDVRTFTLTNTGNATFYPDTIFVRDPGTTQQGAWIPSWPYAIGGGFMANGTVQFSPTYTGNYAGTFTFSNRGSAKLCNAAPTLKLQGSY